MSDNQHDSEGDVVGGALLGGFALSAVGMVIGSIIMPGIGTLVGDRAGWIIGAILGGTAGANEKKLK